MVTIELADNPTSTDIQNALDRIQRTGAHPRGIVGGRSCEYDAETETLRIHFEQLTRILLEHRMYEEADGFAPMQVELLRVIEAGPDRVSLREIVTAITELVTDDNVDKEPPTEGTIQYHLRELRKKNLIEHAHNQYTYVGP